jgi:hypothetical protein
MTTSPRLHSPPAQAAARENAAATQFGDRTSAPRARQLEGIVEGPRVPRDHRNGVRRSHRRPPGAHALGAIRGELGLDLVRGHLPQPVARRRRARRRLLRRGSWGHPAAARRQPSRPAGPPPTPIRTAPTQPLALGLGMENTMAQHYRHRTPPEAATYNGPRLTTAHRGPTQGNRKAGQTSGHLLATIRNQDQNSQPPHHQGLSVDRG